MLYNECYWKGDDMPPAKKFQKNEIVDTAYEIVKKEGFESVNARRIAQELGCSVQPIFHNFSNMEELNAVVYEKIYDKYKEYMLSGINEERGYKNTGLSYIKFAKDFPQFFKVLFMQKTDLTFTNFVSTDHVDTEIIKAGQKLTGLPYEEQKEFHKKVAIFTHGLACLVATNTVLFTDQEIDKLLGNMVWEMLKGMKVKGEDRNE